MTPHKNWSVGLRRLPGKDALGNDGGGAEGGQGGDDPWGLGTVSLLDRR